MEIDAKKLLQGHYEVERLPNDFSPERTVPDFAFNILNSLGLLYRPVVDKQMLANGQSPPEWPEGKPFVVCLTHDVDAVSSSSIKQFLRRCSHSMNHFRRRTDRKAIKMLALNLMNIAKAIKNLSTKDPLHCYEKWLDVERKVGAKSTFFFLPDKVSKAHWTDGAYRYSDVVVFDGQKCAVAEMMREINRQGWEVGLHASWYAFNDADELKYQKEQIENVLGHSIESIRQHYLHYDIRVTPRAHAEAEFKYDSTLGFNNNIGFRFGTSYPWHLYDLEKDEYVDILEIPLIIQDGAMLKAKGLGLDTDTAYSYIVQIAKEVEKAGGVLTLLWHSNNIIHQSYWNLYLRILEYLKKRNAWFGSMQEVGNWWVNNDIKTHK